MEHPKEGMHYEDVRRRLRKYESIKKKDNTNIRDSLLRQAMIHEGEDAGKELMKEHFSGNGRSRYNCSGHKQCGIGESKSGAGDPEFECVGAGKYRKVYR